MIVYPTASSVDNILGKVKASIILDDPDRVYYGPNDPIRGCVRLRYFARTYVPSGFELSAPCKIDMNLYGQVKVQIAPGGGGSKTAPHNRYYYSSSEAGLWCGGLECIFDDWLPPLADSHSHQARVGTISADGAAARDFRFEIYFPDGMTNSDCLKRRWGDGGNGDSGGSEGKFDMDPSQPLPPSMEYIDPAAPRSSGEISVRYTLAAYVSISDTPVATRSDRVPVFFDRARTPRTLGRRNKDGKEEMQSQFGTLVVRAKSIAPPGLTLAGTKTSEGGDGGGTLKQHHRQSFRAKTSAIFRGASLSGTSLGNEHMLGWQLTCSTDVHRGQPFAVQVQLQPPHRGDDPSVLSSLPSTVELVKMTVRVEAVIDAQGEHEKPTNLRPQPRPGQQYDGKQVVTEETVSLRPQSDSKKKKNKPAGDVDEGADTERGPSFFHAGNGWAQAVTFTDISKNLCSSFRTCHVQIAGSRRADVFEHAFPVTLHPPTTVPDKTALPVPEMAGDEPVTELGDADVLEPRGELDAESTQLTLVELEDRSLLHDDVAELEARPWEVPRAELPADPSSGPQR
ncbi:uncharacterized protein B0I36DRAFT_432257 [Microdochium trichocladiopsis]|uniref:Uncharacterized protein n=1 Tax=Microdochium trichocladiopsis TaxID=1682393 RepID=A0A9P8Y6W9_9PEZI|nr:uncharacterized protein B0I36DRAFT_432257 [Microdochium trichocladiopsis]KAH7029488.1 hypothetical protein B0I36DRAFT_432257 [Microdochium trichocladiopsis]